MVSGSRTVTVVESCDFLNVFCGLGYVYIKLFSKNTHICIICKWAKLVRGILKQNCTRLWNNLVKPDNST